MIAVNTDLQALNASKARTLIQIGKETTKGKGAGSIPEIGKKSAEESIDELRESLKDSDMIFVTCGMGGGTGTGASPVIAKIAQDIGALVVGIVTSPFSWEGPDRTKYANDGIAELRKYIDALIIIPNDKLIESMDKKISFIQAYKEVDEVLYKATSGIAEIIVKHGYVNVDFADVKTVMKDKGDTLMGVGIATGEHRAIEATENALNSPFLDGISIKGAQSALINITVGPDLGLYEVDEVLKKFREYAGKHVNIIHGVTIEGDMSEELKVTVVATGFQKQTSTAVKDGAPVAEMQKTETLRFQDLINASQTGKESAVRTMKIGTAISASHLSKPKGNDELKVFEEPAYKRREGTKYLNAKSYSPVISLAEKAASKYENEMPKAEKTSEATKQEHNDITMESRNSHKPAFLRKIMD
jgi:cell division protein FtsZ